MWAVRQRRLVARHDQRGLGAARRAPGPGLRFCPAVVNASGQSPPVRAVRAVRDIGTVRSGTGRRDRRPRDDGGRPVPQDPRPRCRPLGRNGAAGHRPCRRDPSRESPSPTSRTAALPAIRLESGPPAGNAQARVLRRPPDGPSPRVWLPRTRQRPSAEGETTSRSGKENEAPPRRGTLRDRRLHPPSSRCAFPLRLLCCCANPVLLCDLSRPLSPPPVTVLAPAVVLVGAEGRRGRAGCPSRRRIRRSTCSRFPRRRPQWYRRKAGSRRNRQWLQQSLNRKFSAAASSVARVISQNPRLRGGAAQQGRGSGSRRGPPVPHRVRPADR